MIQELVQPLTIQELMKLLIQEPVILLIQKLAFLLIQESMQGPVKLHF